MFTASVRIYNQLVIGYQHGPVHETVGGSGIFTSKSPKNAMLGAYRQAKQEYDRNLSAVEGRDFIHNETGEMFFAQMNGQELDVFNGLPDWVKPEQPLYNVNYWYTEGDDSFDRQFSNYHDLRTFINERRKYWHGGYAAFVINSGNPDLDFVTLEV